jgi:hypothetical protein
MRAFIEDNVAYMDEEQKSGFMKFLFSFRFHGEILKVLHVIFNIYTKTKHNFFTLLLK